MMNSLFYTTRLALAIGLAALLCFGCAPRNMLPVVSVKAKISFVDANGIDKVKGLDLHNQSGYKKVNEKQYTTSISVYPEHGCGIAPLAVDQRKEGDFLFFDIGLGEVRGDYHLQSTAVTLTCPPIFGDDQPHKITLYWDQWACTHVEYNGKVFPATKETNEDNEHYGHYIATVVID